MKLSIIVVSYNTLALTVDCIGSIIRETNLKDYEIIIFDNASCDGSAEGLAEKFPQVKIILSKENLGFARANNFASSYARGEYLLLLNPDTLIISNAIDRLLDFAETNQQTNIWGGRTIFADGTLNPTSCYNMMTLWSLFCSATGLSLIFKNYEFFSPETFGSWKYDSIRSVDIITGCFLLTKRRFWEALNGFDPTFFMYGEEVDFCIRARMRGVAPLFTPLATIIHYGGASEVSSSERIVKVIKAKVTLLKKHWPAWKAFLGIKFILLWVFTRAIGARGTRYFLGNNSGEKWIFAWNDRSIWKNGFGI